MSPARSPGGDSGSSTPVRRVPVPVETRAPSGTTNAYLANGLLVDPAAEADTLDAAVATAGVDAVTVTHTHSDHVGAVTTYAERTDATVYAHADHVDRFREATGVPPDATFRDGETIGSTGVRALGTPGHAPDGVSFVVDGGGARSDAIVGDIAVAEGSVVVGSPEGDMVDYLASLERVRDAGFERLYPGHGPPIDDPGATCRRLIDHRLDREASVLEAVENGAHDVDAVLAAAYGKDLTGVEDLARATVRAHLEKLVEEGRLPSGSIERLR